MCGYVARRNLAQISRSTVATVIRKLKKLIRLPKAKLPVIKVPRVPVLRMPKWMYRARDDSGGDHVCGDVT